MSDPFLGQIIQGGWNYAPVNYSLCAGQTLQISQFSALFALLGTSFGGDGVTNFKLPDLQGRAMVNAGSGPGSNFYALGQAGGSVTHTLSVNELPAHGHPVTNVPGGGAHAADVKSTEQSPTTGAIFGRGVDSVGPAVPEIYLPAGTTPNIALGINVAGSIQVGNTGGNAPFSTQSPYLAVTIVIAMQGIFPQHP